MRCLPPSSLLRASPRLGRARALLLLLALGSGCQCGQGAVTVGGRLDGDGGADAGQDAGAVTGLDAGAGAGGGTGGGSTTGGGGGGGGGGGSASVSCTDGSQCPSSAARCDVAVRRCVECVTSADCPTERPACDPATNTCGALCKSSASCGLPRPVCDAQLGTCIEGACALEGSCAGWRRGPWSACDGTCGGGAGTRTRTVACIDGAGALSTACAQPAPPSSEACVDATPCGVDAGPPPFDAGTPPVDAGTPPVDAGAPDAGPAELCTGYDGGALPQSACHRTVRMLTLNVSMPTCYVDVAAHPGDTAELYWDCSTPHGRAELRFGTLTAVGAWNDPTLSVCFGTHFPWSDGCQWQSSQRVEGTPTTGAILQFTYEERPDLGQAGCVVPCTATGTFVVE